MNKTDFYINMRPYAISFECPHCEYDVTVNWDDLDAPEYWGDDWGEIDCPNCGKKGCKNLAFEMFSNLFVCNKDDMQYADIYEMFDNIIAWLEKFHLGDDCYFVVNKTGATLYRKESPIILHKDYRKRIYPKSNENKIK